MKTTSVYPVLAVRDVPGAAAFFGRHFGFQPLFQSDWYVHLQSAADLSVNLAVLQSGHATIPGPARDALAGGVLMTFEVEDVDAECARLVAEGLSVLQPLRDEVFGQRHVILQGPDGVLIDVVRPIPPDASHAALYSPEALPQ